jgi:hypothetical protein
VWIVCGGGGVESWSFCAESLSSVLSGRMVRVSDLLYSPCASSCVTCGGERLVLLAGAKAGGGPIVVRDQARKRIHKVAFK